MDNIIYKKFKEVIVWVMIQDVEVGLNISDTVPFTMMDKLLIVMGEVDIFLISSSLLPVIHLCLVDHWFLIVMVMVEVDIGILPDNFIHITILGYIFTTQCFLKKLSQGV